MENIIQRNSETPLFNIGVVSRLTGIPVHTFRWIERRGLVDPHRTTGNQRLFSEVELALLQEIWELMSQDVNLPGIRIILRMRIETRKAGAERSRPRGGRHGKSADR